MWDDTLLSAKDPNQPRRLRVGILLPLCELGSDLHSPIAASNSFFPTSGGSALDSSGFRLRHP